jgi:competence protein ComFB
MEDAVFSQMESILSDMNICTCEKCKLDIAAIALNNLPPQYVVTERGILFSKLETLQQQYEISITAAIIRAGLLVKKTPWHESQEGQ